MTVPVNLFTPPVFAPVTPDPSCNPNDLVRPELLSLAAALVPALTYPFLPSSTPWSCGSAIAWSASFNLFFHFTNMLCWATGHGYVDVPGWIMPMQCVMCLVGLGRLQRRQLVIGGQNRTKLPCHGDNREVEAEEEGAEKKVKKGTEVVKGEDSVDDGDSLGEAAANIIFLATVYRTERFGANLFLGTTAIPGSLHSVSGDIVPAGLWCVAVLAVAGVVQTSLVESTRHVLWCFQTRRVSWWFWLQEDDAEGSFRPAWSVVLSVFVHALAPILVVFIMEGSDGCQAWV
jgi:hypothetical protein